ncbi:hypothetical protein [Leptonema illini]|uniref:Uncharacterized protein n=1 Tax=Leptonema illini DSM 21528 TaxID=929563 RepID=H2CKX4_9LEPT|nr:hypothetical protein [Leptonema illini]EHQ06208.1 hypothetical protein Lepil_1520 [Leptonema illini DSM 21528]
MSHGKPTEKKAWWILAVLILATTAARCGQDRFPSPTPEWFFEGWACEPDTLFNNHRPKDQNCAGKPEYLYLLYHRDTSNPSVVSAGCTENSVAASDFPRAVLQVLYEMPCSSGGVCPSEIGLHGAELIVTASSRFDVHRCTVDFDSDGRKKCVCLLYLHFPGGREAAKAAISGFTEH